VLWWDKPLNVECGVRVYEKRTGEPVNDGHVLATAGFWVALRDALSELPAAIVHGPFENEGDRRPWLARVLIWPVMKPLIIIVGEEHDKVGEKRVSTFYPCYWEDQSYATFLLIAIASAFGGIHCIGWSFTFPSGTERTLWRVASVSITSVPIAVLVPPLLADQLPNQFKNIAEFLAIYLCGLQLFLYILSRFVLLVLPFLCLGSLPPAAYHVVHWTSFIPHV